MSGRKQHYIPQALLRGFQAERSGKMAQVVVYKRGQAPYVTSIEGAAAKRDFYSIPATGPEKTLDDRITDFESTQFSKMIRELREIGAGDVNPLTAATAVVHLSVRSAHLRQSFALLTTEMLDHLNVLLRNPASAREYAGIDSGSPESMLAEEVAKEIDKSPVALWTEKDRAALQRLFMFRVRERFERAFEKAMPLMQQYLQSFGKMIPGMAEQGHVKALERSLAPDERIQGLLKFRWRVEQIHEPRHLILPDCLAVSGEHDALVHLEPYVLGSDELARVVAMPISTTQVLIGARDEVRDLTNLNAEFARCSLEFFVGSRKDPELVELVSHLGATTSTMASRFLENESKSSAAAPPRPAAGTSTVVTAVQVQFAAGAGKNEKIASALRRLLSEQCGELEAQIMDSITVAKDMGRAVCAFRGRAVSGIEAQEVMYGSVEFVPHGEAVRCAVLVPQEIAAFLLRPPKIPEQRAAAHLVRHNFGKVTYIALWDRAFPGVFKAVRTERLQTLRLERAFKFGSHYFGGRLASSPPGLVDLDAAIPIWLQLVSNCLTAMGTSQSSFWLHRNVDQISAEMIQIIDVLLTTLASVCGTFAARDLPLESVPFADVLTKNDLWEWFQLFDRDLDRHYTRQEGWKSIEELLDLASHAERLLWHYGVFLSTAEQGQVWVDVLPDDRLHSVRQILKS